MVKGLVIRYCFGKWCVCDGINHDNLPAEEDDIFMGFRVSDYFDTWEEADICRREIYKIIAKQLEDAAAECGKLSYLEAAFFLKNYINKEEH